MLVNILNKYFESKEQKLLTTELENSEWMARFKSGFKSNGKDNLADVESKFISRTELEKIISFTEENLTPTKFLEFLIDIGRLGIEVGQFELAYFIFNKIISGSSDSKRANSNHAYSLLNLGEIALNKNKWKEALKLLKKAEKLLVELNDNQGIARTKNLIGNIYGEQNNFKKALKYWEEGLTFLKGKQSKIIRAGIINNMGIIYNMIGEYDKAYNNYTRALVEFESTESFLKIAQTKHNLGMLFLKKKQFDEAYKYFNESLSLSYKIRSLSQIAITYVSKAELYTSLNEMALAEVFVERSLENAYMLEDNLTIADSFKVKGIIEREKDNFKLSLNHFKTSIRFAKHYNANLIHAEALMECGKLYEKQNDAKNASKLYNEAKDIFKRIGAKADHKVVESLLA
ncbi:MAG: tetratricopeptide repeat protein [Melioribacteraceae bacterium]|nr:tetratricopeptide repeat protein [Melioribacteraceae bacterium]MCF8265131.1 tetratricopeptide repeat protein [Melioribacteraceae bacterium]MCF8432022.1 tetratricopeptide repeat protein [Melioribacteraceae bacterium]